MIAHPPETSAPLLLQALPEVTLVQALSEAAFDPQPRVRIRGKFLWAGEEKFYVRGVT